MTHEVHGKNEVALLPVLDTFNFMLKTGDVVKDTDGGVTVELIGERIQFDPRQKTMDFGVKKTNLKYAEKEIKWYESQDLNVSPTMDDVAIWRKIADTDGKINSNYGYLIYSKENGEQYRHCVERLASNPSTKRAVMIYTRPSMWEDCSRNGMNDFICTDGVQCTIKHGRLYYIVKQRSCDFIYGLFNDLYWHQHVYWKMFEELQKSALCYGLLPGTILYFPFNLHVYEKHFHLIEDMANFVRRTYVVENFN